MGKVGFPRFCWFFRFLRFCKPPWRGRLFLTPALYGKNSEKIFRHPALGSIFDRNFDSANNAFSVFAVGPPKFRQKFSDPMTGTFFPRGLDEGKNDRSFLRKRGTNLLMRQWDIKNFFTPQTKQNRGSGFLITHPAPCRMILLGNTPLPCRIFSARGYPRSGPEILPTPWRGEKKVSKKHDFW